MYLFRNLIKVLSWWWEVRAECDADPKEFIVGKKRQVNWGRYDDTRCNKEKSEGEIITGVGNVGGGFFVPWRAEWVSTGSHYREGPHMLGWRNCGSWSWAGSSAITFWGSQPQGRVPGCRHPGLFEDREIERKFKVLSERVLGATRARSSTSSGRKRLSIGWIPEQRERNRGARCSGSCLSS
jgi:hypothetical protein